MLHGAILGCNLHCSQKITVLVVKSKAELYFVKSLKAQKGFKTGCWEGMQAACCILPATCLATLLRHKSQGKLHRLTLALDCKILNSVQHFSYCTSGQNCPLSQALRTQARIYTGFLGFWNPLKCFNNFFYSFWKLKAYIYILILRPWTNQAEDRLSILSRFFPL